MSTTNCSSLMSPQASACLGFLQDRLKISLVVMFICLQLLPSARSYAVPSSDSIPSSH